MIQKQYGCASVAHRAVEKPEKNKAPLHASLKNTRGTLIAQTPWHSLGVPCVRSAVRSALAPAPRRARPGLVTVAVHVRRGDVSGGARATPNAVYRSELAALGAQLAQQTRQAVAFRVLSQRVSQRATVADAEDAAAILDAGGRTLGDGRFAHDPRLGSYFVSFSPICLALHARAQTTSSLCAQAAELQLDGDVRSHAASQPQYRLRILR